MSNPFEYVRPVMEFSCYSVPGGWQTRNMDTGEFIGPAFHKIKDLWDWQRDNLYMQVA